MELISYCLRYDIGSAPNPFWGVCTLVICKPTIRRSANKGDWIAGIGSAISPIGDISDCLVYAMQVTDKLTLKEYDRYCHENLPLKIPSLLSKDPRRWVGDCIYDFNAGDNPSIRYGPHDENNRQRDLGGKYALLSTNFYYFGSKPKRLPKDLLNICHSYPGHRSAANGPYINDFISWIQQFRSNHIYARPQLLPRIIERQECLTACANQAKGEDE